MAILYKPITDFLTQGVLQSWVADPHQTLVRIQAGLQSWEAAHLLEEVPFQKWAEVQFPQLIPEVFQNYQADLQR